MNKTEDEIKFLKEVIAAQEKFLICYRLGGIPPEWAFKKIEMAKALYGNLQKILIEERDDTRGTEDSGVHPTEPRNKGR